MNIETPLMPAAEYHAHGALGSSRAKLGLCSIQLIKDDMTGLTGRRSTAAKRFGTLAHSAVLEPDRFAQMTTTRGPINPKTDQPYGSETKAFATWQAENPELTVVEPSLYTMIERMPKKVRDILAVDGHSELSMFATVDDVWSKCRPDRISKGRIHDLKTIRNMDGIDHAIRDYQMWFSAAWYRAVADAVRGEKHTFTLIFAESSAPFRWRIVDLSPEYVDIGNYYTRFVRDEVKRAQDSGDWSDRGELCRVATKPEYIGEFDHDQQ